MNVVGFTKKEPLLVASAVLAVVSIFFVPFESITTYDYSRIVRTICILLSFLLVVAGLTQCNALKKLARIMLSNKRNTRSLYLALVVSPLISAMLFSNDVTLFTFVPLTIMMLKMAGLKKDIPIVIILQTAAANIGSSLTPFGNPHNLYMFNTQDIYGFSLAEYELALIPIVLVGSAVVCAITLAIKKKELELGIEDEVEIEIEHRKTFYATICLFVLAVLGTLNVIPWYAVTIIVVLAFLVMMPNVFRTVNYSILFVFFFLFLFASNLINIDWISGALAECMSSNPMLTTVGLSQITSNVSSTILLQPFTADWRAVLVGADIGGFGTPVASMASLITLQFYMREKDADLNRYFKYLTAVGLIVLVVLIPTYCLF